MNGIARRERDAPDRVTTGARVSRLAPAMIIGSEKAIEANGRGVVEAFGGFAGEDVVETMNETQTEHAIVNMALPRSGRMSPLEQPTAVSTKT
jgi:hypothetical protein